MQKQCQKCGKTFNVKPYKFETKKYCSKICASKLITRPCFVCGKEVTRCQSQMLDTVCCSLKCARIFNSKRFSELNAELNPTRMNLEIRTKLRAARLNTGEGKSYTKTFGRHTHRIVAEEKIGRKLEKGEIVHHKDENKRNNNPDNLEILPSQSEHFKLHLNKKICAQNQPCINTKDTASII